MPFASARSTVSLGRHNPNDSLADSNQRRAFDLREFIRRQSRGRNPRSHIAGTLRDSIRSRLERPRLLARQMVPSKVGDQPGRLSCSNCRDGILAIHRLGRLRVTCLTVTSLMSSHNYCLRDQSLATTHAFTIISLCVVLRDGESRPNIWFNRSGGPRVF